MYCENAKMSLARLVSIVAWERNKLYLSKLRNEVMKGSPVLVTDSTFHVKRWY